MNGKRVLVRRKLAGGNTDLRPADVVAEEGGVLTVLFPGAFKPVEVLAQDTMPAAKVFGPPMSGRVTSSGIIQQYPESRSAIGNILS